LLSFKSGDRSLGFDPPVSIGPLPPMKPDIPTLHKPDILILQRHVSRQS
jgi:hypothetical protein